MSALDTLWTNEARRGPRSRCMVCGGGAPVRIRLNVAMVGKGGKPIQGQDSSRSVRVCEDHAADLLARITEILPS